MLAECPAPPASVPKLDLPGTDTAESRSPDPPELEPRSPEQPEQDRPKFDLLEAEQSNFESPTPDPIHSDPIHSDPISPDPESPHAEPLDNRPWLKLVEENVALFDELDRHRADFDAPRREVADHVICRLQEILDAAALTRLAATVGMRPLDTSPKGAREQQPGRW